MRGRFCRAMVLLLLAAGLAGILLAAPEAHAQATSPTPKRPAETGLIIFPPPKEWPEDAIDRLTTTAEAHNRIMVVEVMGRQSGWIAINAGLAGGAEAILVPERRYDLDELAARLIARHRTGRDYSIVIVAEGVPGPTGDVVTTGLDVAGFERLGGVSSLIAAELEERTGYETRVMILGHLQRGGTPTSFDRVLATRMGIRAAEAALAGDHGVMVSCRGPEITLVPLSSAVAVPRTVPESRLAEVDWFLA